MNIRDNLMLAAGKVKARGKRAMIVPLIFILLTSLLAVLNVINAPSVIDKIIISENSNRLSEPLDPSEYMEADVTFLLDRDGGSSLYYAGIDQKVSCVEVSFNAPLEKDTDIQLVYRLSKKDVAGGATDTVLKKGERALTFLVPERVYEQYRVDISDETLTPVLSVSDEYSIVYREGITYDAFLFALILDLVFIVGWLLWIVAGNKCSVRLDIKRVCRNVGVVLAAIAVSAGAEWIISRIIGADFIVFRWAFIAAALLVVLALIKFRGNAEKLFLAISLTVGLMMAIVFPIGQVTWDEVVHHFYAVKQSYFGDAYVTMAERNAGSIAQEDYFDSDTRKPLVDEKNAEYALGYDNMWHKNYLRSYINVGHMPSGLFLYIGRAMGLPFSLLFIFGRFANVLVYALIVYFAIRKLKTGKYILAVIALMPTALFLASNYGYDYWVTAFMMLGFVYYFDELRRPQERLQLKNLLIMVGSFVLALGPKPIYFPLLCILYFIGKQKFETQRLHRLYIVFVTLAMLFAVMSFVLPYLLSTGGLEGDVRGGGDVNTAEQIKYILAHPLEYAQTLWEFTKLYFSFSYLSGTITFFAYLDFGFSATIPFVLLFLVVFTDRDEIDRLNTGIRVKSYVTLACLFTMILVFTCLYITYTPLGLKEINGVQPRYILPVAFPFLMVLGSSRIRNTMNKILYSELVFGIMSFVLMCTVWYACVGRYT
ncbi:MAG: DUF2142 domain-containing protein [Clostridiales Family XIII bacterium]|jgi:uncharacterized membrane protein|nr:DUF2142 domain-containing protein [Clostridiales Family XIII bacterium]